MMEGIVSTEDVLGGEPRIEGRRISVLQIQELVEIGDKSPRTVAERFGLEITEVYRALLYFHEHADEMSSIRAARDRTHEIAKEFAITPPGGNEISREHGQ